RGGGGDVPPDRGDVPRAARAAAVTARTVATEVERERREPLRRESLGEREPRTLVGGKHMRQDDAARAAGLGREQPSREPNAVGGHEGHGARAGELLRRPAIAGRRARCRRQERKDGTDDGDAREGRRRRPTGSHGASRLPTLLSTLPARLLQQLLVLLLSHLL